MKLKDVIKDLQQLADQMGEDADFMLHDKTTGTDLVSDPDSDVWDFGIMRGENAVVVEF